MPEFELIDAKETLNLIQKAQSGEIEAKQKLLDGNYPLIKSIVKRYLKKGIDYEDLYQLGCVGFLKAISNFDPKFNVKFSTYAVPMIAGEIKRFLRDDGEIKISRAIKQLSMKINKETERLSAMGKPAPTTKELAEMFNVDEADVVVAVDSSFCLISLYEKTIDKQESSPNLIDTIAKIEDEDRRLEHIMLKKIIAELPSKERKVLLLRYFRGKTQTEIANMLGISQVQVSRIESKTLEHIKKLMT